MGCASCHGRVDEMPLMYAENTLQMEWCLNCHRNPAKNLRPTSEIYNMAWAGPSDVKPVWCAVSQDTVRTGVPTAQGVNCVTRNPGNAEEALLQAPGTGSGSGTTTGQASGTQPSLSRGMVHPQSGTNLEPNATSGQGQTVSDMPQTMLPAQYTKFTDQTELGHWLMDKYHIRSANELASCEVCHR